MKKILLSLVSLSFLAGEIMRYTIFSSISFRLLDCVVGIIALFCVVEMLRSAKKREVLFLPLGKWVGGFFLIGLISLLINFSHFSLPQIGEAALYLIRWVFYSTVFFFFSDMKKNEQHFLINCLSSIGAGLVLIGFIQYVYYNNLKNLYYLGWDDHMYRIFSSFLDPNFTGIIFTLFSIFLLGRLWNERKERTYVTWLLVSLLGITLVATVLTFSRSALISLGIGSIVFFSLIGRKTYFLYLISVVGGMILLAVPFFYIENVNLFRAASTQARVESAGNAVMIIKDHWLTGVGFNTYRYAQIQYGFRHGVGAEVSHADSGTDNSYLFVLATTGIVGLIIYGGYLRSLLLLAWSRVSNSTSVYGAIFISSLAAVMADSLFINSLFYPFVIVWLWLLLLLTNYR